MAEYLTKAQILAGLSQRAERDEKIAPLGGTVRIRELGRAQFRAAGELSKNGSDAVDGDRWNLAIVAFGVVDPATKEPLFAFDDLLPLMDGDDPPLRTSAARETAQRILDLSEVGPEHLKSESTEPDAE